MGELILVVDDDARGLTLATDLLRVSGYNVITASDGSQAVALAKANNPVLVLMDIQLPVMDGYEATRTLKADPLTRHIKIVALTASAMRGDEDKVFQAGCDGYISKPIEIHGFLSKVREYLKHGE